MCIESALLPCVNIFWFAEPYELMLCFFFFWEYHFLDAGVPVLGPLDGLQGAQVQFPDGSVLVQLDSLDEVLGAGQRGLGGMSQELLGNLRLNIQPGVERVHQGGAGDAGVHSVSRHAGNGGQFLKVL